MRVTYIVADEKRSDGWEETHDFDSGDATEVIRTIIERFNATLRPHERARRLVRIVSIEGKPRAARLEHQWEKQNLVTISERGRMFDRMKCRRCGAMGKRFGLGDVTLDPKFLKQPKFHFCPGYDL